jgi:hypothetical protein
VKLNFLQKFNLIIKIITLNGYLIGLFYLYDNLILLICGIIGLIITLICGIIGLIITLFIVLTSRKLNK